MTRTDQSPLRGEPTLDDLFAEPIVKMIMARDGIEQDDMQRQINRLMRHYETAPLA